MSGATKIRLFGKIFGSQKDYWIAQGTLPFEEEEPADDKQEQRNDGTNTSVYWITDTILGEWIQLPEVHPD
jgi:hypothetical protein